MRSSKKVLGSEVDLLLGLVNSLIMDSMNLPSLGTEHISRFLFALTGGFLLKDPPTRRSLICCISRGIFSASICPTMWGKEGFSGTSESGVIIQISPHRLDVVPVTLWVTGIIHVNIYAASCSRHLLYCCMVSLVALLLWMATWGHLSSLFQLVGPTPTHLNGTSSLGASLDGASLEGSLGGP